MWTMEAVSPVAAAARDGCVIVHMTPLGSVCRTML